ncbi:MAG: hypothetical protein J1G06_04970 [Oscillospiraceae bacterium]|nr:hypothetical protein [Oscillospiraceae bacterium]
MKKRLISTIMAICAITALLPTPGTTAFADDTVTQTGWISQQGENGKYAFFSQDGEQLTEYMYDNVCEDFAIGRSWSWIEHFLGNGGDVKSQDRHFALTGSEEYAVVYLDDEIKYIDTDFNVIDIYNRDEPFYTSLSSYCCSYYDLGFLIQNGYGIAGWESKYSYMFAHKYFSENANAGRTTGIYNKQTGKAALLFGDYGSKMCTGNTKEYLIIQTDSKKYGVVDGNGKLILEPIYDKIYAARNSSYNVIDDVNVELNGQREIIHLPDLKFKPKTVYNTAIKVKINNAEIPCYVIDGYAVIAAEDLGGYGFDVAWDSEKQRVTVTRNPEYYVINPVDTVKSENSGVYTYTEDSDVQVLFNNFAVQAYSIGGKMLIRPETAMIGSDINCEFDWNNCTLNITVAGLETK